MGMIAVEFHLEKLPHLCERLFRIAVPISYALQKGRRDCIPC